MSYEKRDDVKSEKAVCHSRIFAERLEANIVGIKFDETGLKEGHGYENG